MDLLAILLNQNTSKFDIEYRGYLSNHLSHGLIALHKLGADSNRIQSFYDRYTEHTDFGKLEPAREQEVTITRDNWKEYIGKRTNFSDILQFVKNEAQKVQHSRELIAMYYPYVSEGLVGAAFHGMIQLGYGLEVMNSTTIAEGLAYSIFTSQSLGNIAANPPRSLDLISTVKDVHEDNVTKRIVEKEFTQDLSFQNRIRYLNTNYREHLQKYDLNLDGKSAEDLDKALKQLWSDIVKVYAASNDDFFVLHLVTGTRAFNLIFNELQELQHKKEALQYFWKSVVAAYIARGAPFIDNAKWQIDSKLPDWSTIIAKGIEEPKDHEDEHLIKLVFVCHENDTDVGIDPIHRLVAARKVGLLPW